MHETDPLILFGNLLVLLYLIPLALFMGFYYFRSPWRTTELGKALMFQKASFTLIILVIIFSIFFPDYWGRPVVRIIIYGAVLISLWVDYANLLRYQKLGRAQRKQRGFLDESTQDPTQDLTRR